jgi:hypothetical protein
MYEVKTRYMVPMLPVMFAALWMLLEPFRRWRLTLLATLVAGHLGVSISYWLVRDYPRARACAQQWPPLLELADVIRGQSAADLSNTGVVMTSDTKDCVPYMMTLALDRRVHERSEAPIVHERARWLIMTAHEFTPPEFDVIAKSGPYKLLHKK